MDPLAKIYSESVGFIPHIWLHQHPHSVNPDGSIDIDGNVDLSSNRFTELPFTFNKVGGNFDCSSNELTSLKGAPKYVGGGFWCNFNSLTTLEGSPITVGGIFDCSYNLLTTLKGAPQYIERHFDFYGNSQLKTLDYFPKHTGGEVYRDSRFSNEAVKKAREQAAVQDYIRTLSHDDEIENIGDIFD